ncbi:MAG TPA: glycosyl hydrolase family 79 C-terminal domain-containing protein [Solirubrobacteraceae bacterium]|nr:glycosyl hydrolase family 79 C-terminal domain-containing protein [Solirubrobacteraceae bacterium]
MTEHHVPARRPGAAVLAAVVLAAVAMAVSGVLLATVAHHPSTTAPAPAATASAAAPDAVVTIASGARPIAVPNSFLGISTEYWTLPVWARQPALLDRTLALVRPDGPLLLRIGGDSADHTTWAPQRELPEWVFEITPAWLRQTSAIVRGTGARLILDLNLITASPAQAARWATVARRRLPAGSIVAFEVGNEPDIYSRSSWQQKTGGTLRLPQRITAQAYARAFAGYDKALESAPPEIPLYGPALAEPQKNLSWITSLLSRPHPDLRAITGHRYPYSQCSHPGMRTYPTIGRVLSENATAGMAATIRPAVRLAARHHLPLRLTEINSVTCGGRRGVSDTFATALWAPDALFELMQAGARSASVHVRADAINMAFSITAHGLVSHPLFYGMIVFSKMLGPGAQLVPVHVTKSPAAHLKAWAVRVSGNVMHVLLINKGSRRQRVLLRLHATGPATVQRLRAPSVSARSGVTLGGQHLTPAATWQGTATTEAVTAGPSGPQVSVPGYSAALVTVSVTP